MAIPSLTMEAAAPDKRGSGREDSRMRPSSMRRAITAKSRQPG